VANIRLGVERMVECQRGFMGLHHQSSKADVILAKMFHPLTLKENETSADIASSSKHSMLYFERKRSCIVSAFQQKM